MVVILVLQSSMLRFLYIQVRSKDSIAVAASRIIYNCKNYNSRILLYQQMHM